MSNTTKTILIIAGSLLLVCACCVGAFSVTGIWSAVRFANWADTNTTRDLYEVAPMIEEIATITLPDGFGSPYGMHVGEITSVGFTSQSKNTHIMLTQFPQGTTANTEKMFKLMTQYAVNPESRWNEGRTTVIEEKPVIIRGEETTLIISEGTSSDGAQYRSAVATFQGNKGPALVMIAGTLDEWDADMVETFIALIQ
jgi:hypothetical protein